MRIFIAAFGGNYDGFVWPVFEVFLHVIEYGCRNRMSVFERSSHPVYGNISAIFRGDLDIRHDIFALRKRIGDDDVHTVPERRIAHVHAPRYGILLLVEVKPVFAILHVEHVVFDMKRALENLCRERAFARARHSSDENKTHKIILNPISLVSV